MSQLPLTPDQESKALLNAMNNKSEYRVPEPTKTMPWTSPVLGLAIGTAIVLGLSYLFIMGMRHGKAATRSVSNVARSATPAFAASTAAAKVRTAGRRSLQRKISVAMDKASQPKYRVRVYEIVDRDAGKIHRLTVRQRK